MAKSEWGTKRTCPSCGVRFYDMKKKPVECPACNASVPTATAIKTRKSSTKAAEAPVATEAEKTVKPGVENLPDDIKVEDVEIDIEDEDEDDDEDDDSLMEDASDLNEDDDMPKIAEHIETDGDTDS